MKKFVIFSTLLIFILLIITVNAIESDNSYKSPQSDNDYDSPKSDNNYKLPESDKNYSSPTIGSGYVRPNTYNVSSNNTINENETIKKFEENNTQKINKTKENNETINQTLEFNKEDKIWIDKKFVGDWRVYSQSIYTKDGDFRYPPTPNTLLTIKEDGTWNFEGLQGTWEIDLIKDEDWKEWDIKNYGPLRKIVFKNWNKTIVKGPIEEDAAIIKFIWSIEIYQDGGSRWLKFGPSGKQKLYVETKGKGKVLSGDKKIDCGKECTAEYDYHYTVQLRAFPEEGYKLKWYGECITSGDNYCKFNIKNPTTVIAHFVPICEDNSQCPLDQVCENSICEKIECSCGYVNNHQCQEYACCSDEDCGEGNNCNLEIHQCIQKSTCQPVLINGDSDDKHDLVFVGAGFRDPKILEQGIRLLMDFNSESQNKLGVFSLTPFKENRHKFNSWLILAPDYPHYEEESPVKGIGVDTLAVPDRYYYETLVQSCERDTVIILSPAIFRPWANFPTTGISGGKIYMSLNNPIKEPHFLGRILAHEFGHAIGGLADEYIEYGKENFAQKYDFPNCASDLETAKEKWSDLEGIRGVHYITGIKDVPGTTYFKNSKPTFSQLGYFPDGSDFGDGGCAYVHENIRPTISSIMKEDSLENDFGPINERVIDEKLSIYSEE